MLSVFSPFLPPRLQRPRLLERVVPSERDYHAVLEVYPDVPPPPIEVPGGFPVLLGRVRQPARVVMDKDDGLTVPFQGCPVNLVWRRIHQPFRAGGNPLDPNYVFPIEEDIIHPFPTVAAYPFEGFIDVFGGADGGWLSGHD